MHGPGPKLPRAWPGEAAPAAAAALQASVRCLGNWGKLLEIGKYDILKGTPLSMRPMLNNISFEGIDVDRVMNHKESTEARALPAEHLLTQCAACAGPAGDAGPRMWRLPPTQRVHLLLADTAACCSCQR